MVLDLHRLGLLLVVACTAYVGVSHRVHSGDSTPQMIEAAKVINSPLTSLGLFLMTLDSSTAFAPSLRSLTPSRGSAAIIRSNPQAIVEKDTDVLTPLPPRRTDGVSDIMVRDMAAAIGRAVDDGVELIELDFFPLYENRQPSEDFSNVDTFVSNFDFGGRLSNRPELKKVADGSDMWVVCPRPGEVFPEADNGLNPKATMTYIEDACRALGNEPITAGTINVIFEKLEDMSGITLPADMKKMLGMVNKKEKPPFLPAPKLQLLVQPGNLGSLEDWQNMPKLKQPNVPMICLNGELMKPRENYYGIKVGFTEDRWLLGEFTNDNKVGSAEDKNIIEFMNKMEAVYLLKPITLGKAWLYRVYPEPYQLIDGTSGKLLQKFKYRPSLAECATVANGMSLR